jgi:peptide/nickel transport system substrate-binding protein/oligopeptide transport system substrate-binding protein
LFATLALLAGCNLPRQAKQSDLAKDQTLKMVVPYAGTDQSPFALDPATAYGAAGVQTTSLLFDGLVTIDRNEHIEPWGAIAWTVSPDGLEYTFVLRPNQRFSDGVAVKPSDYAWSMDRAASPCLGSSLAYYLAAIRYATAFSKETCSSGQAQGNITTLISLSILPDDSSNTLTIRLAQPAGYFLAALSYPTSYALERSAVSGADLGKDGVWVKYLSTGPTGQGGSGMFYVASTTPANQDTPARLTLKPNPHWWGLRSGKTLHFTEIDLIESSAQTAYSGMFRSDPTIAWTALSPDDPDINAMKRQPYYHAQPALTISGIAFNWKITPFDDINARKAFCLAINRDQISQQIYQSLNIPSWHLVPQGMDGYNAQLKGIDDAQTTGNASLAREYWQRYLAARGEKAPAVKLVTWFTPQITKAAMAAYQQQWLQALGVIVTQQTPPGVIYLEGNPNPFQMFRFIWAADYPDPQDFLSQLFRSDAPYNTQSASVGAADTLMKQADAMPDMSQRIPLYNQAEQLLIDNVAVCPLFQYVNHYALRTWVKGDFVEDARGLFPNDAWVSGYIAKQ